jgi:hypothetical protein
MTYDEECDDDLQSLAPPAEQDPETLEQEVRDGRVDEGAVQGHLGHARRDAMAVVRARESRRDDFLAGGQSC